MPWFYYSGNVSRTLPVKKGLSVAVAPHSKVEILDPNIREVQALRKKGLLRRTGRPAGAKSVQSLPGVSAEDVKAVTPRSAMSQKIAEKGVTKDKGQAPKTPKGRPPEMTDGELLVKEKEREEADAAAKAPEEAPAEAPAEVSTNDTQTEDSKSDSSTGADDDPSGDDSAEMLSNVDGSPDEDTGGDEGKKPRKKKRRKK